MATNSKAAKNFSFVDFLQQRPSVSKPIGVINEAESSSIVKSASGNHNYSVEFVENASVQSDNPIFASQSDMVDVDKKMKRVLANRNYARKARIRKQEEMTKLKHETKYLKVNTSMMSVQIAFEKFKNKKLQEDNLALKRQVEHLVTLNAYKTVEYEKVKSERDIFRLSGMKKEEKKFI